MLAEYLGLARRPAARHGRRHRGGRWRQLYNSSPGHFTGNRIVLSHEIRIVVAPSREKKN